MRVTTMDQRIRIVEASLTRLGSGTLSLDFDSPTSSSSFWAAIDRASGSESLSDDQRIATTTRTFVVRKRAAAEISPTERFRLFHENDSDRAYDIKAVSPRRFNEREFLDIVAVARAEAA